MIRLFARTTLLSRPGVASLRVATFVVLTCLLAACADTRAKFEGPYADLVGKAVPRIEAQVGLTFKTPPTLETRSHDEVATFVMKQLTSDKAKVLIDGQQRAYRVLGLIPDTLQLAPLLQRLLEEQIIGFYDPATKVLYVVDGAPKALLAQTVTHELVHALQDQYIKVDWRPAMRTGRRRRRRFSKATPFSRSSLSIQIWARCSRCRAAGIAFAI